MQSGKDVAVILWHSNPVQISKNGNWRIRYGYRDSAGKEHQTTETVATIAKRDRFVAYLDRKIKEGKAPKRVAPLANGRIETVAELLTAYADVAVQKYARGQKDGWSDKTYKGNVGLIRNYIVPQIGNLRVWEVTAADVRNALDRIGMMDRARGNHKKEAAKFDNSRLVYDCKKIISKAFWWAVEQEMIEPANNPMLGVKYAPPKSKHRNVIPEALLDATLDIAKDTDSEMYLLMIIVAMLSSRCGEIYGLRWSDYDHDNAGRPIIHVNKTLTTCDKSWIDSARGKGIIEVIGNPASTASNPRRTWVLKTTNRKVQSYHRADDKSRGRDRSSESYGSDVIGASHELYPQPSRGNYQGRNDILLIFQVQTHNFIAQTKRQAFPCEVPVVFNYSASRRAVMAKLTKYEKETIVLFNEGEDMAHIQTYSAGLRKRLAAFSKKYPHLCRLERSYEQGGASYVLDKSRLSIRLQPPYSEERKRKASENAKQNGFTSHSG